MRAEGLVVRPAGLDDLHGVVAVHARRDPGTDPPAEPSARQRQAWDDMIERAGLTVYVGVLGDEVVGTATLLLMPNLTYDCDPTAFVEAVVVDHRYRRQGIASSILDRALADARLAGVNKVQLLSHKRHADDGAHDLYLRLGFTPDAEGFRSYLRGRPATAPEWGG